MAAGNTPSGNKASGNKASGNKASKAQPSELVHAISAAGSTVVVLEGR